MKWLAVVALVGCGVGPPGPGLDTDRVIAHASALVEIGPRPGETPAAAKAIAYIESALGGAGVRVERAPVGTVDLPEIAILGQQWRAARRVTLHDPNLIARFGPPGRALLIMAHYDTVRTSPGALDNAAAVGLLIELARELAAAPPAHPVIVAFPANEEVGLVGAEALAAQRADQVALAISLDVIGGPGDLALNGASMLIGAPELGWLAGAADRAGVVVRAPLPHRVISRWWPQAERSDHGPFTRRGVRAFHFYGRGHDGDWIDLAYHTERDVVARIDRGALADVGRLLRALAAEPPPPPGGDGVWLPVAINTVAPRWPVIALEVALGGLALAFVVRTRDRTRAGGLGVLAGMACYAAAAAATVGIERAIAGAHPAPWLHAPRWSTIAIALILVGALGLATRVAARIRPWSGDRRYLAIAVAVLLILGLSLLFAGAAELACLWLVPAAMLATAPRWGRARVLAALPPLLPAVLILAPRQLREAAWNGFLPPSMALAVWVAILGVPVAATLAWYLRIRHPSGPLGTLVLSVGCGLAISLGAVMLLRAEVPCSAAHFQDSSLACEVP